MYTVAPFQALGITHLLQGLMCGVPMYRMASWILTSFPHSGNGLLSLLGH